MRSWWSLLPVAGLLAPGCAPGPRAPVQAMAVAQGADGLYRATQVTLKTLSDAVALKGNAAALVGEATIVVDPGDPLLQSSIPLSNAQVADVFLKGKGGDVHAHYLPRRGNVLWPEDFHTWNMVTLYFNLEQAYLYWLDEVGATPAELESPKAYYWASYTVPAVSAQPQVDDALFVPPVQGFVVLPFSQLQGTPLPMNAGAMAHEVARRVFYGRVYGGAPFPAGLTTFAGGLPATAANVLASVEVGLADFHAYGASCSTLYGCNPRFLAGAVPDAQVAARDFSTADKCMTPGLSNTLNTYSFADFTSQGYSFQVGTVLAAALYHAELTLGDRQALERAVLASYSDTSPATPGLAQAIDANLNRPDLFTLELVGNTLVQHITTPALASQVCSHLLDRLKLDPTKLTACTGIPSAGNCP